MRDARDLRIKKTHRNPSANSSTPCLAISLTVRSKIEKFYARKKGNHVESSVTTYRILLYRLLLVAVFIVAMEWTNYHVCVMTIRLMKTGKNGKQIHTLLKLLKVSKRFIYRILALYNDTGDLVDWLRSGWPRCSMPDIRGTVSE